jgi:ornithine cyclodeaminase/alanine dehydrogenase
MTPLYLTEAEVARLVTIDDAIASLEECFAAWHAPTTNNLPRQRAPLPSGVLNLMGATYGHKGVYGLKVYLGGRGYHVMLYAAENAELLALIEANLASQLRTGAASGVATRILANPEARTLAVLGSGKQARAQVLAVCAVRPIREIRVFSPSPEHRADFAGHIEAELGVGVRPTPSAQSCVEGADIVIAITKSAEPVCRAEWLTPGAHINAAGANAANRRELDADSVLRATVRATDHRAQAQIEAAEFRDLVSAGKLAWSDVCELGELLAGKAPGRKAASDVTLFKSLGIALEDVAFAEVIYRRAVEARVGRRM